MCNVCVSGGIFYLFICFAPPDISSPLLSRFASLYRSAPPLFHSPPPRPSLARLKTTSGSPLLARLLAGRSSRLDVSVGVRGGPRGPRHGEIVHHVVSWSCGS